MADAERKCCIVFGSSRGIGRQIALSMSIAGYHVVVTAKSITHTQQLPGTIYSVAKEVFRVSGVRVCMDGCMCVCMYGCVCMMYGCVCVFVCVYVCVYVNLTITLHCHIYRHFPSDAMFARTVRSHLYLQKHSNVFTDSISLFIILGVCMYMCVYVRVYVRVCMYVYVCMSVLINNDINTALH